MFKDNLGFISIILGNNEVFQGSRRDCTRVVHEMLQMSLQMSADSIETVTCLCVDSTFARLVYPGTG